MCLSQDVNRGAIQMQLVENFVQYFCLDLEIKLVGSCGTFSLNAPISISKEWPPMCHCRSKSVESCSSNQRETAFKELDEGLELHLKPHSHKELNCVVHNVYTHNI